MNEKEARTWAGRRQIIEINARRPMNTPSPNSGIGMRKLQDFEHEMPHAGER
jgi:hypothetical protein